MFLQKNNLICFFLGLSLSRSLVIWSAVKFEVSGQTVFMSESVIAFTALMHDIFMNSGNVYTEMSCRSVRFITIWIFTRIPIFFMFTKNVPFKLIFADVRLITIWVCAVNSTIFVANQNVYF